MNELALLRAIRNRADDSTFESLLAGCEIGNWGGYFRFEFAEDQTETVRLPFVVSTRHRTH